MYNHTYTYAHTHACTSHTHTHMHAHTHTHTHTHTNHMNLLHTSLCITKYDVPLVTSTNLLSFPSGKNTFSSFSSQIAPSKLNVLFIFSAYTWKYTHVIIIANLIRHRRVVIKPEIWTGPGVQNVLFLFLA